MVERRVANSVLADELATTLSGNAARSAPGDTSLVRERRRTSLGAAAAGLALTGAVEVVGYRRAPLVRPIVDKRRCRACRRYQ